MLTCAVGSAPPELLACHPVVGPGEVSIVDAHYPGSRAAVPALFGAVASDSTCWRQLDRIDDAGLAGIARARAAAREVAWAQHAETRGAPLPPARAAQRDLPGRPSVDDDDEGVAWRGAAVGVTASSVEG